MINDHPLTVRLLEISSDVALFIRKEERFLIYVFVADFSGWEKSGKWIESSVKHKATKEKDICTSLSINIRTVVSGLEN